MELCQMLARSAFVLLNQSELSPKKNETAKNSLSIWKHYCFDSMTIEMIKVKVVVKNSRFSEQVCVLYMVGTDSSQWSKH